MRPVRFIFRYAMSCINLNVTTAGKGERMKRPEPSDSFFGRYYYLPFFLVGTWAVYCQNIADKTYEY